MVSGLQTLVRYFKGRCPAAVNDYLKNKPARCMRTKSSRGMPSGASFFFSIGQDSTVNIRMLVCPDALILNKVGSAIKYRNEDLLLHTYLDEATSQMSTCLIEDLASENTTLRHFPHYTPPPVVICMRSWKTIEAIPVPSSEWATSFA